MISYPLMVRTYHLGGNRVHEMIKGMPEFAKAFGQRGARLS